MSFQTPITVEEAVDNIHTRKYLLPAIRREVVWDVDQIERLSDSLMRDYPIGSFLFWHVPKEKVVDYQFYEFVRGYHGRNRRHNPKANVSGEHDITGILDDQQRLTSLYIGLRGSYAYKEPRKHWDNPQAFPTRRLYLNLLVPKKNGDETDMVYDFAFSEDRKAIRRWLILSLVERVFGGSPDMVLRPIRDILRGNSDEFPLNAIIDKFKGSNKSIVCTQNDVDNMLYHRYGQGYTFSILVLFYPTLDFRNKFHIDHIHPRSAFTRARLRKRGIAETEIDVCIDNVDRLANLQLLEGVPNQEKGDTDFYDWIKENCPSDQSKSEYMKRHFIPDVDLTLSNFPEFVEKRNLMLRSELCRILGVQE